MVLDHINDHEYHPENLKTFYDENYKKPWPNLYHLTMSKQYKIQTIEAKAPVKIPIVHTSTPKSVPSTETPDNDKSTPG